MTGGLHGVFTEALSVLAEKVMKGDVAPDPQGAMRELVIEPDETGVGLAILVVDGGPLPRPGR